MGIKRVGERLIFLVTLGWGCGTLTTLRSIKY